MANSIPAQAIVQNLKDAGCDSKTIKQFLILEEEGKLQEQLKLLTFHRNQLLDRVHREEKRIDCLDYLVYQIRKGKSTI